MATSEMGAPATPGPYNPYGPPPSAPPVLPPNMRAAAGPGGPPIVPGGPPLSRRPFPSAGWFLLLTLIGFAVNAALSAVGAVAASLLLGSHQATPSGNLLGSLPPAVLFSILLGASLSWPLVAVVGARLARTLSLDTFRLRSPGFIPVILAFLTGVALVPLALALEHLSAQLVPRGDNFLLRVLAARPGALALALLGVTLVASAPVGEELLFRGLALRGLERRYGWWPAAILVSGVFASVHLNLTGFLSLASVSLVLCWLTSRTDSLLPAMAAHAAYNGAQFVMLLFSNPHRADLQKALDSRDLGIPLPVLLGAALLAGGLLFGVAALTRPRAAPAPAARNPGAGPGVAAGAEDPGTTEP